ncbi:MAG: hypothetical protein ACRDJY_05650 [Thermoleophilaceae bacterium]
MEIVAAIVIATLIGPFLIGWWIGHPVFAAVAWGALGLTVLLMQLRVEDPEPESFLWIVISTVVSAGAAFYGGLRRERRRQAELERR